MTTVHPMRSHLALLATALLAACGGGGGGGSDTPTPNPPSTVPTVSSATVGTPSYGQPLLVTINGTNLDRGIVVSSPGCGNMTLVTSGVNTSSATTAYYTCTLLAAGPQEVRVQRSSDAVSLATVAYTVRVPQIATATATVPAYPQKLLITLTGSDLDQGLALSSNGCSDIALSTAAPNLSTANRAFYTCTPNAFGDAQVAVRRALDGVALTTVAYTVPTPTVTGSLTGTAKYSQSLLLVLNGTGLDQGLTVSSGGCRNVAPSTNAAEASTATTAYFRCTVAATGAQSFRVVRTRDGAALPDVAYTVPAPQVTLGFSNGAAVAGSLVVTLEPDKAPATTDNFLAYVASGFYVGTVIHRNAGGFVLQGGGYTGPLTSSSDPVPKPTNAAIVLEDGAGLSNLKYTVAMARTNVPDSATSQFFINLANNTFLNRTATARGYAVFGTITAGTTLVDDMATAPCVQWLSFLQRTDECLPLPNLVITAAEQTR